ncbi:MAG: nitrogen regulation protein NR(II), partial [Sphingomonadales bacterium]
KLSYATEQCPSVIMIVDTDSRIEYVNPKFEELTGYTLDEMKGKKPSVLKSGETSSAEYDELWQTIRAGREWHGLFHNRKKNGELYWESASISAIRDAEGKITHYLAVKEDVTERIRLEQKVEERNAEIAKTQALAATGRMANMIAHDLRNPLSTIKMGLQMLGQRQSRDWDEEDIETKQLALEQVHYMEEILADLLSYSRPPALTPEWLSISNLLNTTVITTQRYIEKYRAQVNYTCQPELPTLHGDARKLRQAFSNMIVNAVQAMEDLPENEREIEICVELDLPEDGPRIRVEIRDRGHGIAPERMAHLFEPFFTTRAKGTGLGLAIVKNIVDQHQGTVELMPRTGGGTRAVICLPIGPIQCETAAGGPAPKGSKANDFQDANL